jgi:excinuclease ABC subunit B
VRRRTIQTKYNEEHGITPQQIIKDISGSLTPHVAQKEAPATKGYGEAYIEPDSDRMVADPIVSKMTQEELAAAIAESTRLMNEAAKRLDFLQAAQYRDEVLRLQERLKIEN